MATDETPISMVAPKSKEQTTQRRNIPLQPVEQLATEKGIPPHTLAGMRRAYNWPDGKQVSAEEFDQAVTAYSQRQMGTGCP